MPIETKFWGRMTFTIAKSQTLTILAMLFCLSVSGCVHNSPVRVVTNGSNSPLTDEEWDKIQKNQERRRFVVWGNHAGATQAAISMLQQLGQTVVERARIMEIFEEQRIQLTHSPDDDARILKVGRLVGADRLVFVEASDRGEVMKSTLVGLNYGESYSKTLHHVSVSVRCVNVENGEIRWSGHSTLERPTNNPEGAIPLLTRAAISRAMCPLERGYVWTDLGAGPEDQIGCRKKEKERSVE